MIKKFTPVFCLAMLSTSVLAQTSDSQNGWRFQPEFSVGGGYGMTKLKDDDFEEDEAAKKAFAIVKFNEYIGFEGAYIDFDEAGNDQVQFDPTGMTLGLILEAPITQMFSLYAKGGQMWWDADTDVNLGPATISDNYDGDETFWGAGAKFRLTEHLDLKVEYERFNFDISRDEIDVLQSDDIDLDVDYASVNLQFTF